MSSSQKKIFSLEGRRVFVAGHNGMVGSALLRRLSKEKCDILTVDRKQLDLKNFKIVNNWFAKKKPEAIFFAAALVGGIYANKTYPVDFLSDNLAIQNSVITASFNNEVKKFMFLGSSCIYPRNAEQPLKEEALLTGEFEKTNESYAIAKIAGLKLCQAYRKQYGVDYISVMPTNLYGPNDNFHPENSHVIPGLIARMTEAKKNNDQVFKAWGTGNPRREFLYVDDMAKACIHVMNYEGNNLPDWMNIGTGEDISIKELVYLIKETVGFEGQIEFDSKKPDGTMKKLLDVGKIKGLGWEPEVGLEVGIENSVRFYETN